MHRQRGLKSLLKKSYTNSMGKILNRTIQMLQNVITPLSKQMSNKMNINDRKPHGVKFDSSVRTKIGREAIPNRL